jgi:hypothetical protein
VCLAQLVASCAQPLFGTVWPFYWVVQQKKPGKMTMRLLFEGGRDYSGCRALLPVLLGWGGGGLLNNIRSAKQDDNYGASNIILPCPSSLVIFHLVKDVVITFKSSI